MLIRDKIHWLGANKVVLMLNDEAIGLKWTREQLALLFYKLVSWYIDVYTDADGWSLSELLTLMRLFN